LYVDDLLVTGSSEALLHEFKEHMLNELEMNDIGKLIYFFGIKFTETKEGILMHPSRYAKEMLRRHK